MRNPWTDLPAAAPFVLPQDKPILERQRYDPFNQPQLRVPPSPFMGDPSRGKVLMLLLNPGFSEEDVTLYEQDALYREALFAALEHRSKPPMWSLDHRLSHTGAYQWSTSRCRVLAEQCGWEALQHGLLQVQYFPYKSGVFKPPSHMLPSQEYGFWLVREAMAKGMPIILTRGRRWWCKAIPALSVYPLIELNNPRSPYLSPRNMGDAAFERVAAALCA